VLATISKSFARIEEENGQALVEYALILMLVALVTVGALTQIGIRVNNILNGIAGAF
jgi:pilus assembly protein Flp/PilA